EDYAHQVDQYLANKSKLRDSLLAALVADDLPAAGTPGFSALAQKCLRSNRERIIERFPAYARLADAVAILDEKPIYLRYINEQFLSDLLVWYHLGWLGETVRRDDKAI